MLQQRNLRLYVFQDRYYPNLTESQHQYLKEHLGQISHAFTLVSVSLLVLIFIVDIDNLTFPIWHSKR
jgi:hypothetical protein